ncbi:MAG: DUF5677 domain-containing protein [Bacteroidales bacterium]
MTKPINDILPKEIENGMEDILLNFSLLIDEFVHFGTHVLKWMVQVPGGSDEQMPLILFFRDLLEKADSISILVKNSSIDPSKQILRSLFETHMYIDYLTEKYQDERAMAFLVWDAKRKIQLLQNYNFGTQKNKQLRNSLEKDKSIMDNDLLENLPEVKSNLKKLQDLLKQDEYLRASKEYDKVKKNEGNPNWYRLFNGPRNIQQLANHIKLSFLYETLYRNWSGSVHGTDIVQGKITPSISDTLDGDKVKADIIQIRLPKDAQQVTAYTLILLVKTFRIIVNYKVPNKQDDLKKWYLTVRDSLTQITGEKQLINMV